MTIDLSPQLETALVDEAVRRGTTPNALAAQLIESQLSVVKNPTLDSKGKAAEPQTMYDRWKEHLEAIEADKTPRKGPINLSEDTGRRFAELLEKKRRQGSL